MSAVPITHAWKAADAPRSVAEQRMLRRVAHAVIGLLPMPYRANKFIVTYEKPA